MEPDANPGGPSADDLAALARYATTLADGVEAALPGWVVATVRRVHRAQTAVDAPPAVLAEAERAGAEAAAEVGPRVRALLATDVDAQTTNPLSVVRSATRYPTEVLRRAGVAPVERDHTAQRQFPDDDYDLTPASFADLDPDLHEPGLIWGAAKAHVHLARRRAEGRR
jgi:hypothetical protein